MALVYEISPLGINQYLDHSKKIPNLSSGSHNKSAQIG